jgi:RNA recognition motif-containing protein
MAGPSNHRLYISMLQSSSVTFGDVLLVFKIFGSISLSADIDLTVQSNSQVSVLLPISFKMRSVVPINKRVYPTISEVITRIIPEDYLSVEWRQITLYSTVCTSSLLSRPTI